IPAGALVGLSAGIRSIRSWRGPPDGLGASVHPCVSGLALALQDGRLAAESGVVGDRYLDGAGASETHSVVLSAWRHCGWVMWPAGAGSPHRRHRRVGGVWYVAGRAGLT